MNTKIYLDQKGYDEYLDSIETLMHKLQSNSSDKSESYGSAVGDGWHDNFAFEDAKREETKIIMEIDNKRALIKNIEIIEDNRRQSNIINIDDIVKLQIICDDNDIEEGNYKLVGSYYPKEHELSLNSPIGKAIYRKKIGTTVQYFTNKATVKVFIIAKIKSTN